MRLRLIVLCNLGVLTGLLLGALHAQQPRVTRADVRRMLAEIGDENREARIQELYEKYGKPMRERLRKARYRDGKAGENTKVFVFKKTPQRDLKIYIDFPPGWKKTDRRSSIVFWHGGGFTQGSADQFLNQCQYFTKRGMVCARPEYRIADVDDVLPHRGLEDGISAMRWFKGRAAEFGIDADKVVAGGGSAGGCQAAVMGTVDAKKMAELEFVGEEDHRSISPRPAAMLLYNPFVDFFEPENARHVEEESLMMGQDPRKLKPVFHTLSAIEHVSENTPPNIILFGTRDAFYPQQIRWIVECRRLGVNVRDYVYKGEVHSWYNNSPHLEYTTRNVDDFLVSIGLLDPEPRVELPHRRISPNRTAIQQDKYSKKKDWDEAPKYRRYIQQHQIKLIPYKHYERN
ncbi:MAG: alpha/beta hydrolase [bacterium]|nr:alpha/beta hydrolase [bacterium]